MHILRLIIFLVILITFICCASSKVYNIYDNIEIGDLTALWKQKGLASWYGEEFDGRKTASGEIYDMNGYTAAHRTLPFGTIVLVRNIENSKEVKVKINDRGPFKKGRVIDLSYAAAKELEMLAKGVIEVEIFALEKKD